MREGYVICRKTGSSELSREYMNTKYDWDVFDEKETKVYKREGNAIIVARDKFNCRAHRPGTGARICKLSEVPGNG